MVRSDRARAAWRTLIIVVALVWVSEPPADAHPAPFSYLDLRIARDAIEGAVVVHVFDAAHDLEVTPAERLLDVGDREAAVDFDERLTPLLAQRFHISADGHPLEVIWRGVDRLPDRQSLRLRFTCPLATSPETPASAPAPTPATLDVDARLFPYDPQHQTFVNIYEGGALTSQAILDHRQERCEYVSGAPRSPLATIARFLPAGIHHILIGPDHLLFLVGLLLLGGTLRRLALVVTAFTLAHSVTLSLAALQILTPPARVIEPAIALSIIYVGADNLLVREGRDVRAWIAFAFGFIHGFGFASVLREMGLPAGALGWSLFSFNVGVEIGQLLVVVVVATALAWLRARSVTASRRLAFAGSIAVIAAGTFWFVQRVFSLGGMS